MMEGHIDPRGDAGAGQDRPVFDEEAVVENVRAREPLFQLLDARPVRRALSPVEQSRLAEDGFFTTEAQRTQRLPLRATCNALLGRDERQDWDRAYIVRKEAEEALQFG